jgi:hypothetical protein
MRVQVQYDVPVSAVVDTASGKVESVIVWDEAAERRDGEFAVVGADTQMPVAAGQRSVRWKSPSPRRGRRGRSDRDRPPSMSPLEPR